MTLKFTLFSQEKEDFALELLIDSDAKFNELHQLILDYCHFQEEDGQHFLICDEDWHIRERILRKDNGDTGSDEDLYLMDTCTIGELLDEEGQRMAYVFDSRGKRFFLMELSEIIFGQRGREAHVNRHHGTPPSQYLEEEAGEVIAASNSVDVEEDFYGEDGFEEDELDMEGFEINE